jgi:hypothetical protein
MPSVIEVLEIADGLTGGASLESGGSYTRVFQIEYSGVMVDPVTAILDSSVPVYGATFPTDSSSIVTDKQATPETDSNGRIWRVTVKYSRPQINPDAQPSPNNPGEDGGTSGGAPPGSSITSQKWQWSTWSKTIAPQKDRDGLVFANSAGDLIDPPPTREDENLQLTYTRTQSTLSIQWLRDFNNAVNLTGLTIDSVNFAARTLKCKITAERPAGAAGNLWLVTITLMHDPDGWDWQLLDAGYRYKSGTTLVDFVGVGGIRATKPRLLNGAGAKLADGGDPVFKTFRKHKLAAFEYLALDY